MNVVGLTYRDRPFLVFKFAFTARDKGTWEACLLPSWLEWAMIQTLQVAW